MVDAYHTYNYNDLHILCISELRLTYQKQAFALRTIVPDSRLDSTAPLQPLRKFANCRT
jgi:hypothetical protein